MANKRILFMKKPINLAFFAGYWAFAFIYILNIVIQIQLLKYSYTNSAIQIQLLKFSYTNSAIQTQLYYQTP